MKPMSWRDYADEVLRPLFAGGRTPTTKELFDAYPFNERQYTPYKIWLEQIKRWKKGGPLRLTKDRRNDPPSKEQGALPL